MRKNSQGRGMRNMQRERAVVALGTFDGVHLGHRAIFEIAQTLALELNATPCVFSFYNHPQTIFGQTPQLLTTAPEKRALIEKLGLQATLISFTLELMLQTPEEFFELLLTHFELAGIVVGDDYRFGYQAAGDVDLLQKMCDQRGIRLIVTSEIRYDGVRVSSSRIREALQNGALDLANTLLVDPYHYTGMVGTHAQIGRQIGYPTANIWPTDKVIPLHGIYVTRVLAKEAVFSAVTNIGRRPTVENKGEVIIEAHILEECGDLYNRPIQIDLLAFLREEKKFDSMDDLRQAIAQDCENAWIYFREKM